MVLIPDKRDERISISKVAIIDHLVGAWRVLQHVSNHATIQLDSSRASKELNSYIVLMEQTVSSCQSALKAKRNGNHNCEYLKLSSVEDDCGYLKGGGVCTAIEIPKLFSVSGTLHARAFQKQDELQWNELATVGKTL